MMARAFIGIGSNIDPGENVLKALRRLAEHVRIIAVSTVYLTPPLERPDQPSYYNCVAAIETGLSPERLKFQVLRGIEADLGRHRSEDRFAARAIDLDLLVYDDLARNTGDIVLPDPEITRRAFLAVPLSELDPELFLTGIGRKTGEIAAEFSREGLNPLPGYTASLRKEVLHDGKRNKPGENPGTGA